MIPLFKPVFNKEMQDAAIHSLSNEKFVMGESVFKFEEEFARYCGTDFAVSASSGTNALQLTMLALGVPENEAITCPASFVATSNSVIQAGGKPVFVDCDPVSRNLDPKRIESKMNAKTKAILPIHLYGNPADMDMINEIATKRSVPVVEDACQAHGALYKGKKAGNLGDAACFSFYSTKNLTVCGDGGMVTTNDEKLAKHVAKLRDCGRISQYEHDELGYTSRLNTVNAAIGRVQLRLLDAWVESRHQVAKRYTDGLKNIDGLELPRFDSHSRSSLHLFSCLAEKRDALAAFLKEKGVQTGQHYPIPIHLQPLYRKLYGYREGDYPHAENLSKHVICLPMYPDMSEQETGTVINSIKGFLG